MGRRSRAVRFPGSLGVDLAGNLDLPDGEPFTYAVFAHCFTCGKDNTAASRISRGLVEAGYGVLRFDFTGLGASEGEFADTNFTSNAADLTAAAEWLTAQGQPPTLMIGHSLGGTATLAVSGALPTVEAVVTIGAPADPAHASLLFSAELDTIEQVGEAEVSLGGRTFLVRRELLDDLRSSTILDRVVALRRPLLVLHSPIDDIVGVEHAARLFESAKHPKSYVSLDRSDHLLSDRNDAAWVAQLIATWAGRYVG